MKSARSSRGKDNQGSECRCKSEWVGEWWVRCAHRRIGVGVDWVRCVGGNGRGVFRWRKGGYVSWCVSGIRKFMENGV